MSEHHRRLGVDYARDHDRRMSEIYPDGDEPCHYLARLDLGHCEGKVKNEEHGQIANERHHVKELADNRGKDNAKVTVPACRRHHQIMTNANKAARAGKPVGGQTPTSRGGQRRPSKGGQPGGQNPDNGADSQPAWVRRHLLAAGAVLMIGAVLWMADMSGEAILLGSCTAVYGAALAYYLNVRWTRARDLAEVHSLAVRSIKADPRMVRVDRPRWRWQAGMKADIVRCRIFFPGVEYMTDPGTRARVEKDFWVALHARIDWPAHALHPHFDVRVVPVDAGPGRGPVAVEAEPQEETREKIRTTIEEDLHKTMKLKEKQKLTFTIVERDAEGPLVCTLDYPAGFQDGSEEACYLVQERISAQLDGIRFVAQWDRRAEKKRLTLTRRPELPAEVPFRFPAPGERLDPMVIPLGIDETQRERAWNLRVHPHMIFAGATGAGKSYTLAELIYQLLIRGWQLILIDGKGTTFAPFRRWPGVVGYGLANAPESMAHWMEQGKYITEERYDQAIDHDVDPASFPRLMVLIDELTEANENVAEWWKELRSKEKELPRECPAIGAWASVARKGREGGVHLLVATQQPNASDNTFGSTETKANLAGRFFLGPTEQQSALMMFGRSTLGRDIPEDTKGRGTLKVSPQEPGVEVQTYFTPRPKPSGAIAPEHETFFAKLMPLVEAAQAKVKRVAPAGGSIDMRPDPRFREIEPTKPARQRTLPLEQTPTIDVWDLAARLKDEDVVECWLDGERLKVVEVIGEDEVEITHVDAEGKQQTLIVDDSARFELRGESS